MKLDLERVRWLTQLARLEEGCREALAPHTASAVRGEEAEQLQAWWSALPLDERKRIYFTSLATRRPPPRKGAA